MKFKCLLLILSLFAMGAENLHAQNRNSIWCFGDSAGIDFTNLNNPVPIATGMDSRGSCASISDTSGNLLFYASDPYPPSWFGNTLYIGAVYTKIHTLMENGDTIVGDAWYNEVVIIPLPNNDSIYYVFNIGSTLTYGLYYSVVNINANNGLGAVIQKNVQLQSFATTDCLNAIKHGNGRDWWVIFRKSGVASGPPDNNYYEYLITPSGIGNMITQSIGSINSTNNAKITFSSTGDKMVFSSYAGLIELYDFDRCSGIISTPITIHHETLNPPYHLFWGSEFSPSGNRLYVTISDQTSYLFQFDLTASNIWASIDTLWVSTYPGEAIGGLKRGPDGKIYESGPDTSPLSFIYPYPDTLYTVYNMNLGVINSPDNLGAACDFQPYSFNLGGKRTYWGLPNNPDYELPALAGSLCDTLLGVNELNATPNTELFVYYSPAWQTAFINAQKLTGREYTLRVVDALGNEILLEKGTLSPPYFTKNLNCAGFAKGMYVVVLQTEDKYLSCKFIIQ